MDLANSLLHTFPMRLRDAFEEMTPENTPLIVYDLIIFPKHMVRDLEDKLTHIKEVQRASSG